MSDPVDDSFTVDVPKGWLNSSLTSARPRNTYPTIPTNNGVIQPAGPTSASGSGRQ